MEMLLIFVDQGAASEANVNKIFSVAFPTAYPELPVKLQFFYNFYILNLYFASRMSWKNLQTIQHDISATNHAATGIFFLALSSMSSSSLSAFES